MLHRVTVPLTSALPPCYHRRVDPYRLSCTRLCYLTIPWKHNAEATQAARSHVQVAARSRQILISRCKHISGCKHTKALKACIICAVLCFVVKGPDVVHLTEERIKCIVNLGGAGARSNHGLFGNDGRSCPRLGYCRQHSWVSLRHRAPPCRRRRGILRLRRAPNRRRG